MKHIYSTVAFMLFICAPIVRSQTFYETYEAVREIMSTGVYFIGDTIGIFEKCPYSDNAVQDLTEHLQKYVSGQELAMETITNAVAMWEFHIRGGHNEPLVLAVTGPTGTGKSESALRVAEGLLQRGTRIGTSLDKIPRGLLTIRGEDYATQVHRNMSEVHRELKRRLGQHLLDCDGQGVVVFDEVQKVAPGTLNAFIEAMSEQAQLTFMMNDEIHTVSTRKVVFILISDIGSDNMLKLLLSYPDRRSIPQQAIRSEVNAALAEQGERLQFQKTIREVVPFLPMEQQQIEEVMRLKLRNLGADYKGIYWWDLVVSDEAIRKDYIKYEAVKYGNSNSKIVATHGARSIETGGPLQDLKSLFFRYVRPWRNGQILHVAYRFPSSADISRGASAGTKLIFIQWCKYESCAPRTQSWGEREPSYVGTCHIDAETSQGHLCETKWYGTSLTR